jgi:hypothetical protein
MTYSPRPASLNPHNAEYDFVARSGGGARRRASIEKPRSLGHWSNWKQKPAHHRSCLGLSPVSEHRMQSLSDHKTLLAVEQRYSLLEKQKHGGRALLMSIRCPVCGVSLQPELIPAAGDASFPCSRCRTPLKVSAPDETPIVAISVVLALALCAAWGLKGQAFVLVSVGLAAVFYLVVRLVQTIVAAPKLQKSRFDKKLPRQAARPKPMYRAVRGGRVP